MFRHALTAGLVLAALGTILSAQYQGADQWGTVEQRAAWEDTFEAWFETPEGEWMREDWCARNINAEELDEYAEEFCEYGRLGTSAKGWAKGRITNGPFPCDP